MKTAVLKEKKIIKDKRKSDRVPEALKVEFRSLFGRVLEETHCLDIGGGGLKMCVEKSLRKGDKLMVRIYFPGDPRPVQVFSEVVWNQGGEMEGKNMFTVGIRHFRVHPKDRERLPTLFCELMMNYFLSLRSETKKGK